MTELLDTFDEFGNKKISFDLLKFSTGTLNNINLDSIENVGNNTLRFIFSDISWFSTDNMCNVFRTPFGNHCPSRR